MGTAESRSEIPGKFGNVVLEKDGEKQLNIFNKERNILNAVNRREAKWTGHTYLLRGAESFLRS